MRRIDRNSQPVPVNGVTAPAVDRPSPAAPTPQVPDAFAAATSAGPIDVAGARIPRLDAPASRTWANTFGGRALEADYRFYDKTAFTHLLNKLFHQHDLDTPREVATALSSPLPTDAKGAPKSFGDVTVVVNGMLNLVSTPASMFRLAMATRGALVIASSNPAGNDGLRLRPLTDVWGTPVPPELKGKLFAIGDLSPNMIPWPQASDLFLEQLSVLEQQFGQLKAQSPGLGEVRSLHDAKVTVVGYSQGAVSVAAARKRLDDHGRGALIDRVVSVAGSFSGTPFADVGDVQHHRSGLMEKAAALGARILGQVDHEDGRKTIGANDPDFVAQMIADLGLTPALVDVAYQAKVDGGGDKVEPFFKLTGKLLRKDTGGSTDGVVSADAPFGTLVVRDEEAKTHLSTWKDFRTFDRILEALP